MNHPSSFSFIWSWAGGYKGVCVCVCVFVCVCGSCLELVYNKDMYLCGAAACWGTSPSFRDESTDR